MAAQMDGRRLRTILESLLCASGEPLTAGKVLDVLEGATRAQIERGMGELQAEYERDGRGFRIAEVAGGYQLRTAAENSEWVRRLFRERAVRLTRPTLETLAIVAYKQPVTRAEVEAIRGVEVDSVLTTLLERRLVRIVGRKEAPGRPLLYATTREFLEVFGLRDLTELPTLKELGELTTLVAPEIDLSAGAVPAGEQPATLALDGAEQTGIGVPGGDRAPAAGTDNGGEAEEPAAAARPAAEPPGGES
jgi:segregation and condensation protein B